MPIIATSPPIIFGEGGVSTPSPTPPSIYPTVIPPTSTPNPISTDFINKHQQFISQVDILNNCFKKEQITNFTNDEFDQHVQIAMIDKYITQTDDLFCTMQGVHNLSIKLKRFVE